MAEKVKVEQKGDVVLEKVPLLLVYMENGELKADINDVESLDVYKMYGFLDIYLRELRDREENEEMEFINTMVKGKRIIQFWLLIAFIIVVLAVGYVISIIG
jgi:hypothetical protein